MLNFPQILLCFKISSTRLFALQCSKKLTNPITLTAYSLLPKSTSSTATKSPPLGRNIHHFLAGNRQKYRSEFTKTHHFKRKIHFFLGMDPPQTPLPVGKVPLPTLDPRPNQAFWIRPCISQISSQIDATGETCLLFFKL